VIAARAPRGDDEITVRIEIGFVDLGFTRLLRHRLARLQLDLEAIAPFRNLNGVAPIGAFPCVETMPAIVPPTGCFGPPPIFGPG